VGRASLTGAANDSAGPQRSAPRTVSPQQSGLEHNFADPSSLVGAATRRRCWRLELEFRGSPSDGQARVLAPSVAASPQAPCHNRPPNLDQLPATAGSRSSRGVWTPHPRRAPDLGAVPEPFALFTRAGTLLPLGARSPVRAVRYAPAGLRGHTRRWGRGGSAVAGRGGTSQASFFVHQAA
jgi:hypothetical protein